MFSVQHKCLKFFNQRTDRVCYCRCFDGGTEPVSAIDSGYEQFKKLSESRGIKNHLFIMITDGLYEGSVAKSIEAMKKKSNTYAAFFQVSENDRKTEDFKKDNFDYCAFVPSFQELPRVVSDLVKQYHKKIIVEALNR